MLVECVPGKTHAIFETLEVLVFGPRPSWHLSKDHVCLQRAVPLGYYVVVAVREFDPAHHHETAHHHEFGGVSPDSVLMLHDQTPKYKFVRRTVFQSCPRVHFSWTRPDPAKRWPGSTRPAIADKKSDPTRPDLRLDSSPICAFFNWIIIY